MNILEYIDSIVNNKNAEVLEIGTWHGMLSDRLYSKGIKITASESLDDAPIWSTPRGYEIKKLDYVSALTVKHWDIVIANNVIHHLHSPYHFWDMMTESCNKFIVSSCAIVDSITHKSKENTEKFCGPHLRRILLPLEYHVSCLEEKGWIIEDVRTDLLDTRDRPAWLISASCIGR